MEYFLGIDIGTGSTKAVAVNSMLETLAIAQHHYETRSSKPGYAEQDPEEVWSAFRACLADIGHAMRIPPRAIALSCAMHSLIAVDGDGQTLGSMMTWADGRSGVVAEHLKESGMGKKFYLETGMPVHAMSPLCKVLWIRKNDTALFDAAHRFISIKEFIWYKIFGEYCVDHSVAAATGFFNISGRKWDEDILRFAGISTDKLSQPVSTSYSRSDRGMLSEMFENDSGNVRWVIGSSDGCLATLGSFATVKGTAALTIGTSGAVRVSSSRPLFDVAAMTFCYPVDEEIFICGGPVNNGGNILEWLMKEILDEETTPESYDRLFDNIRNIRPGANGLLFLPYLNGERAPLWDSRACGVLMGLRSIHSKRHLTRAAIEGICFALYEVLQTVEKVSGTIDQINVSGGFVQSETWMQILSDITGKKLKLFETADASAIGAAMLAMTTLGLTLEKTNALVRNARTILPDVETHRVYSRYSELYKRIYPSLKDTMHELSHLTS